VRKGKEDDYDTTVYAMFLTLSPDDQARPPYITGRVGAFTREVFIRFVIAATLAQQRFPCLFVWLGKRRYEQAQHQAMRLHHV
jgi:hypothetical protein